MFISEIPFYFQSNLKKDNGGYPPSFPFQFFFDETYKMYRQQSTDQLEELLKQVYAKGSLVDGSISNESGAVYIKKTVDYIQEQIPDLRNKKVLEIGCGSGIILQALSSTGAHLTGLDPGNHKKLNGIHILQDYFPSPLVVDRFDLILHFLVLEHVINPVDFLIQQKKNLKENGKIIFAVPNCQPFLETGDISIFIHEHFNYFTKENIKNVVAETGLFIQDIRVIEGLLFVSLSQDQANEFKSHPTFSFNRNQFEKAVSVFNAKIVKVIETYKEEDIAIYVAGRALNTLFNIKKTNTRLIDDNSEVHGKYLPCLSRPIESFNELISIPPKCILIYSRTFGERIKEKCVKQPELKRTSIITLEDVDKQ